MMNDAIKPLGAPEHLIQIITEPSIELTNELMQAVDVVIATGGGAMVKAAYSSGKPAYGVGPGNVQCIIDKGVTTQTPSPKSSPAAPSTTASSAPANKASSPPQKTWRHILACSDKTAPT
jgi:hypothetical protein